MLKNHIYTITIYVIQCNSYYYTHSEHPVYEVTSRYVGQLTTVASLQKIDEVVSELIQCVQLVNPGYQSRVCLCTPTSFKGSRVVNVLVVVGYS